MPEAPSPLDARPVDTVRFREEEAARRMLFSFAHPDDESFGPAGTIGRYVRQGVAVHYVCGTRGELGEVAPERLEGFGSVAELRTEEMRCAAEVMGLGAVHYLNYRDSGMEGSADNEHPDALVQAPLEDLAGTIAHRIRHFRPQVLVTFDPTGGYFHPDHIKMHEASTLAFQRAGDPAAWPAQIEAGLPAYAPQKLYYMVFPRRLVRFLVRVLPLVGQDPSHTGTNKDVDLRRVAEVHERITTKIDVRDFYDLRQRASHCHESQYADEDLRARFSPFVDRWLRRNDHYERVAPPVSEGAPIETDLFAGIEPDPAS